MRITMLTFTSLLILACVVPHPSYAQETPEGSLIGKQIYDKSCAHCHGLEGRGDGSAAENLLPRPRDFTRGLYKIRSTESGQLPTDKDLFDIITVGMPGTSMPEWETSLDVKEREEVVKYIKTFYSGFQENENPPREISLDDKIPYSQESVEIGKDLYVELGCVECHGKLGRGDGTSAPTLVDAWDFKTWPANLTENWNFRGGSDSEDFFKRFIGGIAGSPMPAFQGDTFYHFGLTAEQSEQYATLEKKVEDGEELTTEEEERAAQYFEINDTAATAALDWAEGLEMSPETLKIYNDAMKVVYEKSWHLANYVKSLSPEKRPDFAIGKHVLRSQYLQGELPALTDETWNTLDYSYYPLIGQIVVEPRQFNPSIDAVNVKSFYNDTEVAFLFSWDDKTHNTSEEENEETGKTYEDAIAIQFPVKPRKGPTDPKPYFIFGGRKPVYLWQWKASAPDTLTELTAKGINNVEEQEVQGDFAVESDYTDGRYMLWVKRSLKTDDKKDLQLDVATFVPIAFSVWDGGNGDIDTKRVISSWYSFVLEPLPSTRRFIYPPLVALLSFGLLVGLRRIVQRRNS
ncbi:c-type cytochrome [Candidatus Poribacteria bacterium]|nr:c-type cytochrome [Candidatus Poribacteria bacterium]